MNYVKKGMLVVAAALVLAPSVQAAVNLNQFKTEAAFWFAQAKPVLGTLGLYMAHELPRYPFIVKNVLPFLGRSTAKEAQVLTAVGSVLSLVDSVPVLREKLGAKLWLGAILGFAAHKVASSTWVLRAVNAPFKAFNKEFRSEDAFVKEYKDYQRYQGLARATEDGELKGNNVKDKDKKFYDKYQDRQAANLARWFLGLFAYSIVRGSAFDYFGVAR